MLKALQNLVLAGPATTAMSRRNCHITLQMLFLIQRNLTACQYVFLTKRT